MSAVFAKDTPEFTIKAISLKEQKSVESILRVVAVPLILVSLYF